ncbi:hypothetical protein [Candidatus Neptunichlamydia sp. REUL1]|uniref:hypothetical protein n=1 Tax=Candidatus Neptunichlamydia sp. REUL1 TaxID=3064277 RepID=UPI002930A7C3|nr:hypothetical protein [Candidatus Neptunochlamydia sp. REUL1]
MKKNILLLASVFALLTIQAAAVDKDSSQSLYAGMQNSQQDSESLMGHIQTVQNQNKYNDTNFTIGVTAAAVQPTFSIPYFANIQGRLVEGTDSPVVSGQFKKKRLPADYNLGITGQFSYLIPTQVYLDLFYNYYHISSSASDRVREVTLGVQPPQSSSIAIGYGASARLKGQYHFAEFYFRTRVALLNLLDKYFHNELSLGFSFQNINLHHINNFTLTLNGDEEPFEMGGSLAQQQKHKVFGWGPSFKWESQLDLLPMHLRPHNLSFISEVKFALLFANYYAKGKVNLDIVNALDIDGTWRRMTDYLVTLNTVLKAGLRYTYKNFSFEGAYKILYFSDEDYNKAEFFKGTLAEGIIPDVTNLFNIFPTNLGFRAFEFTFNWDF